MAGSNAELLKQLSENIEKIRKLGLSEGYNDQQIDYCIEQVVAAPKVQRKSKKISLYRRFVRLFIGGVAVLFTLFTVLFIVSSVHAPTDRVINQIIVPLTYPLFRFIRLGSLPITKRYDLTKYYDMPCLFENPYYEEEEPDCSGCNEVTKVAILENMTEAKFTRQFLEYHQYRPAIVQGEITDVSFSDLQNVFVLHLQRMGRYVGSVNSNVERLKTPQDLFMSTSEKQIRENKNFYAEWISKQMGTSQILRELFKRPSFLPKQGEISLEKTIIVENSQSEKHSLPREGQFPYVWYVQASGSRDIVFSPHPACQENCKTIQTTIYPGEMLFYLEQHWKVDSHPSTEDTRNSVELCVSFHGYFM